MKRLTNAAVSALLLAAFAGTASAQFVADDKPKPEARTASSEGVRTIVTTTTDGTVYKLVARDGAIDGVWINDEPVPMDRVVKSERTVRLLDGQGNTVHEFRVSPDGPAPAVMGLRARSPDGAVWAMGIPGAPSAPPMPSAAPEPPPPVMLGINLSEPGEALRAQLGLGDAPAILIDGVIDGLPASEAGVKRFDIIVSIDGSDGASGETLSKALRGKQPGETIKLVIVRDAKKITVEATLAAFDAKKLGREEVEIIYDDSPSPRFWVERDENGNVLRGERLRQRIESLSAEEAERAHDAARRAADEAMRRSDEIQRKVEQAMRDVERKVLELRGDQLFVRSAEEAAEMARRLEREAQQRLPEIRGELDARLDEMERRFEALERDLESRLDRLASAMERLVERLEKQPENRED